MIHVIITLTNRSPFWVYFDRCIFRTFI